MQDISISAQITPNPNTLKFVVNKILLETGSVDFSNPDKAVGSPVVEALYKIEGITGVLVGTNFVSISKSFSVDWATLAEPITDTLQKILGGEGPYLNPELMQKGQDHSSSEIEQRIKEILDTEIRPAVAMDGGDIVFYGYEDGVVSLHLQGACSSCPSSTLTLKLGIENRLREELPEIREVVQI